jgi:sporulation protein YabP
MQNVQQIIITDKSSVEIDTVVSVRSFDENGVVIDSSKGLISIEGSDLRIENFEKSSSKILITGIIMGVFYLEKKEKRKGRVAF